MQFEFILDKITYFQSGARHEFVMSLTISEKPVQLR